MDFLITGSPNDAYEEPVFLECWKHTAVRFFGIECDQNWSHIAMKCTFRRIFPILTAMVMVFWLSACAGESHADAEGGEGSGEHAAMEGGGGEGEAFESFTAHPEMSPCG